MAGRHSKLSGLNDMPKRGFETSRTKQHEARYQVVAALLQADGPLTLADVARQSQLTEATAAEALADLAAEKLVVQGRLSHGAAEMQYRWAARWEAESGRKAAAAKERLQAITSPARKLSARQLGLESRTIRGFHNYIIHDYTPPKDKRLLVFFQCSVSRPFSKSPSHASIRRAVAVATRFDPARDFDACPVHVVVLASTIGPVPYELEDVYPANVGGGGVKHFSNERYHRDGPVLAGRMADYLSAHRACYDHRAAFAHGRYGQVMAEAGRIAGQDVAIFPAEGGPKVLLLGGSVPRTYWQKYWIQLCLAIGRWMGPAARRQMTRRLKEKQVEYK